jgi:hypothetical protein
MAGVKMLPKILRVETLCKYSLEFLYALRQTVGLNGSTVPTNHIMWFLKLQEQTVPNEQFKIHCLKSVLHIGRPTALIESHPIESHPNFLISGRRRLADRQIGG